MDKLVTSSLLQMSFSCNTLAKSHFFNTVDDGYGIDEENMTVEDLSETGVTIQQGRFALTEEHLHELQTQVDPLQESENHRIELYEQTLTFIQYVVSHNTQAYNS